MNAGQYKETKRNPLILAVDDDPRNLEMLGVILRKANYRVTFAQNGRQALERVQDTLPDLILLDIVMPEMSGYEVCEKLKKSENYKNIPIILITAKTKTNDIIKGFQLGIVDYVAKPFNSVELLVRVKTHLELKSALDTQKNIITKLENALATVKQLKGLLPICCHCKNIRDDKGYWQSVEEYITNHSETEFSHGICPECIGKYYSEQIKDTSA